MAGRSTEPGFMPHSLVASPALQHPHPTSPHPALSNVEADPLDAASDPSASPTDSLQPRSLQSQPPPPNTALQPSIAASIHPAVPTLTPAVQTSKPAPPPASAQSQTDDSPPVTLSSDLAKDNANAVPTEASTHVAPMEVASVEAASMEGANMEEASKEETSIETSAPEKVQVNKSDDASTSSHITRLKTDGQIDKEDDSRAIAAGSLATSLQQSMQTEAQPTGPPIAQRKSAAPMILPTDSEKCAQQKSDIVSVVPANEVLAEASDKKRDNRPPCDITSPGSTEKHNIGEDANDEPGTKRRKINQEGRMVVSVSCSSENVQESLPSGLESIEERLDEGRVLGDGKIPDGSEQQGNEHTNDKPDIERQKEVEVSGEVASAAAATSKRPRENVANLAPKAEMRNGAPISDQNAAPESARVVHTAGPVGGILPMLRSSPVALEAGVPVKTNTSTGLLPSQPNVVAASDTPNLADSAKKRGDLETNTGTVFDSENGMDVEPKKRKTVSWAPEQKLVDIQFIDTRLQLVRSWDPESEITLPFAPGTLQMFRAMSKHEELYPDSHARSIGSAESVEQNQGKKMSAFEAARKKEHDMELDRARKAREEHHQKELDKMTPALSWRRPSAIVLPAECRIDADGLECVSLGDEDGSIETPESSSRGFENNLRNDKHREGEMNEGYYHSQDSTGKYVTGSDAARLGIRRESDGDFSMPERGRNFGDGASSFKGMGGFQNKNGQSLPPHAVQHLLSALQSSGLLNNANNSSHGGNDSGEYSSNNLLAANERDHRGERFRDRHGPTIRNGDGRMPKTGTNGVGRLEGERIHMRVPEEGSMGPGPGMGMSNGGIGPPPPPPMLGHPGQMPPGFQQGVQPGMMDQFPFPMPPMPPPPMGMHPNMLPLGMGLPMPPMGMPLPFGMPPGPIPMNGPNQGMSGSKVGKSGPGRGREVETITRPKSKGPKQRKKCKYFGTKQGCRDGNSCVFAHN